MSEVGAVSGLDYEDIGLEELRARNMQAVGGSIAIPLPKVEVPSGFSKVSSIDAAKEEKKVVLAPRPKLEEPPVNAIYRVYSVVATSERQTAQEAKAFESRVKEDFAEIEQLNKEKEAELLKYANSVKTRDTWNIFSIVAQYFISATTIVLGIAAIASGAGSIPGALLIASGGLNILNGVMRDTGGWNAVAAWFTESEELQEKIASRIHLGLFFLSIGMGLAGGIWAAKIGALSSAGSDEIKKIIGYTAIFGGFTKLGAAYFDRRSAHLRARMAEIDYNNTSLYHKIYQNSTDARKMVETNDGICDDFRKMSTASQVHFD